MVQPPVAVPLEMSLFQPYFARAELGFLVNHSILLPIGKSDFSMFDLNHHYIPVHLPQRRRVETLFTCV